MHRLELPYPISANRYWRNYRGRMVVSAEATRYKREVALAWDQSRAVQGVWKRAHTVPLADMRMELVIHPKKPKRKTLAPIRCLDVSNCIKIVEDALQGIAWENDKQLVEIVARRGEPVEGGRLVVCWDVIKCK